MSYKGKKKRIIPSAANKKAIAERVHAKNRIKERLGFEVTSDELKRVSSFIQKGKYIAAERQTNKRTKFLLVYPGTDIEIVAIYDRKTKNIVTVWRHENDEEESHLDSTDSKNSYPN